jgi:alpha-glucosidase
VLGNHDQKRIATRVGAAQARVAAMLLLTLRGTPTLYYGDELGLEDVAVAPERVQDPWARNEPGLGLGRDPARTPMPWDASAGAGFSGGEPWLPLNADYPTRNVAALAVDGRSILTLYRRLIALRREQAALHAGDISSVRADGDVLIYDRGATLVIALNLGHQGQRVTLPFRTRLLLSTELDRQGGAIDCNLDLRAAEGVILKRI